MYEEIHICDSTTTTPPASSHPTSPILISTLSTSPPPSSPTNASLAEDSTYSCSNYDYDITEFNFIIRSVMKKRGQQSGNLLKFLRL
ncbi:hypothetical protein RhiirA1_471346 [Rhizophagus irregularis]|uniref:Uncharacterized protein n=1 Tax=Rhizophagus irregularis TaxID=588596 RepID=A0A2I1F426_9GLOM|nr:hypothetical protein RhiirA1_471346 [Rhizophagus irregularis]PKY29133.1 hypothetical protein RhiirB3_445642 [Rhizophagus irregularis]CAB4473891.1 unnamed protein product [Rhizophagus irregularis]CAB5211424.1 unnamed protein product [Rhizophagus irregularis]CAB5394902.1 unnamed protein product [Rhizophagus irregularis]